jgi:ribosomal protein L6P/L9E
MTNLPQQNLDRLPTIGFTAKAGADVARRVCKNRALGLYSLYYSVLVVRGIGYRILYNKSDLEANYPQTQRTWNEQSRAPENWNTASVKFRKKSEVDVLLAQPISQTWQLLQLGAEYNRVLALCMGHAYDQNISMATGTALRQYKKNRKLVFYHSNSEYLRSWAYSIFSYRPPSIYTGRGIRRKKKRPRRKLGKKDARKGRVF